MDIPYDFSPLVQHNARNQDEKKQRSNSFYRSSVHLERKTNNMTLRAHKACWLEWQLIRYSRTKDQELVCMPQDTSVMA